MYKKRTLKKAIKHKKRQEDIKRAVTLFQKTIL